jgi:outer membrane protein
VYIETPATQFKAKADAMTIAALWLFCRYGFCFTFLRFVMMKNSWKMRGFIVLCKAVRCRALGMVLGSTTLWGVVGASNGVLWAQVPKVAFVNSNTIRERFPDYQTAKQRLESLVADWKRQSEDQLSQIQTLEAEIQKKRLIWSEAELKDRELLLQKRRQDREEFIRKTFNSGGSFDTEAANLMRPVEAKIAAAIQEVAITENYDYVWDKSSQPLLYANPRFDVTAKVMDKLGLFTDDIKAKLNEAIDKIEREINKARQELSPSSIRRRLSRMAEDAKKVAEDTIKEAEKEFKDATKDLNLGQKQDTSKKVTPPPAPPQDSTKKEPPKK